MMLQGAPCAFMDRAAQANLAQGARAMQLPHGQLWEVEQYIPLSTTPAPPLVDGDWSAGMQFEEVGGGGWGGCMWIGRAQGSVCARMRVVYVCAQASACVDADMSVACTRCGGCYVCAHGSAWWVCVQSASYMCAAFQEHVSH